AELGIPLHRRLADRGRSRALREVRKVSQGSGTTGGLAGSGPVRDSGQLMHIAGGAAPLLGFAPVFLHAGPDHREFVALPSWLPVTVLLALLALAGVVTLVQGVRVFGRSGVDPATTSRAKWYGTAWLLGFVGLILTIGTISGKLSPDNAGLVW